LGTTPPDSQFRQTGGAHDFIVALPKGYDDEVGKQGIVLSSG
jgi:ABC-type bacteriocin/lantibiotic exporter with double-glycine peptidase domain